MFVTDRGEPDEQAAEALLCRPDLFWSMGDSDRDHALLVLAGRFECAELARRLNLKNLWSFIEHARVRSETRKLPAPTVNCSQCGVLFEQRHPLARVCSKKCRNRGRTISRARCRARRRALRVCRGCGVSIADRDYRAVKCVTCVGPR